VGGGVRGRTGWESGGAGGGREREKENAETIYVHIHVQTPPRSSTASSLLLTAAPITQLFGEEFDARALDIYAVARVLNGFMPPFG